MRPYGAAILVGADSVHPCANDAIILVGADVIGPCPDDAIIYGVIQIEQLSQA